MEDTLKMLQKKSGMLCRLCPPLEEQHYEQARAMLPGDLFELLKISDGIHEMMIHPNANNGKPFVIGSIVYSFNEIITETKTFSELFGNEGIAFAGNGAGGYYIIKPDGKIYLYEYVGEDGEYYAENIKQYLEKY